MRYWLSIFLLILIVACHRDQSIGPLDALYRRWHLIRSRLVQDTNWTVRDTDAYYDLAYRSDGTIIYRRNGVSAQGNCCAPTEFNRQGVTINYTDWVLCYNAFCATVKTAKITQLNNQFLELTDGYIVSQYEAAD